MKSEGREMYKDNTDEELVIMSRKGDDMAEEALIRRYVGELDVKSHVYYIAGADKEDVKQEGMIGLVRAIRTFDEKKSSFGTYANLCMNRQIYNAIKKASRDKHKPLNDYEPLDEALVSESIYEPEGEDMLSELLAGDMNELLSGMEKKVLDLYLAGKSYKDIAKEMNRQPKSIDNCMQRIRKKIQGQLLNS